MLRGSGAAQVLTAAGGANAPVWRGQRGQRGHYEVWYATGSKPGVGGFWFRCTLRAPPGPTAGRAVAEVWGVVFRPAPLALKATAPIESARLGDDAAPFVLNEAVEGAKGWGAVSRGRVEGELEGGGHRIRWDLAYEPPERALYHFPKPLIRASVVPTKVCSPALGVTFVGSVEVDGEDAGLDGARGCQTHVWGSRHAAAWCWGHCSSFGGAPVVLEVVSARPDLRLRPGPPFTFVYCGADGHDVTANAFPWNLTARSWGTFPRWGFSARTGHHRLEGEISMQPSQAAQVTYHDPGGRTLWCTNSCTASATLRLWHRRRGGWSEPDVYESGAGGAQTEFGSRVRRDDVPVIL